MDYDNSEIGENSNSLLTSTHTQLTEFSADYLAVDKGPYRQSFTTWVVQNNKTITYDTSNHDIPINNLIFSEKIQLPNVGDIEYLNNYSSIDKSECQNNKAWNTVEEDTRSIDTCNNLLYSSTVTLSKPSHPQRVWFDREPKKHSVFTEKSDDTSCRTQTIKPMGNVIQMAEKTTCCRPGSSRTQQYVHRVTEKCNKLRELVKKIVEAREREKQNETWNNYIEELKNKYRYHEPDSHIDYDCRFTASSQQNRYDKDYVHSSREQQTSNPTYSRYIESFPISSQAKLSKREDRFNTIGHIYRRENPCIIVPKDWSYRQRPRANSSMDSGNEMDIATGKPRTPVRRGDIDSSMQPVNSTTFGLYERATSVTKEILMIPFKKDQIEQVGSGKIQKSRTTQKDIFIRHEMATQDSRFERLSYFEPSTKAAITYPSCYRGAQIIMQNSQTDPKSDKSKQSELQNQTQNNPIEEIEPQYIQSQQNDRQPYQSERNQYVQQNKPERGQLQASQLQYFQPQNPPQSEPQYYKSHQNEALRDQFHQNQSNHYVGSRTNKQPSDQLQQHRPQCNQSQQSRTQKGLSQQSYTRSVQSQQGQPRWGTQSKMGHSQQSQQKSPTSYQSQRGWSQRNEQQQLQSAPIWERSINQSPSGFETNSNHLPTDNDEKNKVIESKLQNLIQSINYILAEMRVEDEKLQPTVKFNTCNKLLCVSKRNIAVARDDIRQRMKKKHQKESDTGVSREDSCFRECEKQKKICLMDSKSFEPSTSVTTIYKEIAVGNTENVELNTSMSSIKPEITAKDTLAVPNNKEQERLYPDIPLLTKDFDTRQDKSITIGSLELSVENVVSAVSDEDLPTTSKTDESTEIEQMFLEKEDNIEASTEKPLAKVTEEPVAISSDTLTNIIDYYENENALKNITEKSKTGLILSKSTIDALKVKLKEKVCACKQSQNESKTFYTMADSYLNKIERACSKINEILDDETTKSMKVKKEINDLINDELYTPSGVQIDINIPCRDISTEVTSSLAKTSVQQNEDLESNSKNRTTSVLFPYQQTTSMNTESYNLSVIWRVSSEAIRGLLSFLPFISNLPLPLQISWPSRSVNDHYVCHICGAAFNNTSDMSDHVEKHCLGGARDCCVCRHHTTMRNYDVERKFRCKYCGQRFLRAYCCDLHMQTCAKRLGIQHDVRESLATLT